MGHILLQQLIEQLSVRFLGFGFVGSVGLSPGPVPRAGARLCHTPLLNARAQTDGGGGVAGVVESMVASNTGVVPSLRNFVPLLKIATVVA